jgi:hypothetical protein
MFRQYSSIILLLIIFAGTALADVGEESPDTQVEPQTVEVQDVINSGAGDVTVTEPTQFNTNQISGVANPGTVSNGDMLHFDSLQSGHMGDTHIQGGTNVDIEDEDSYSIAQVSELKQGTITITNGFNVRWNGGILTADSASSLDYKGSTSTDVVQLTADGKEFFVQKASAVQAGCFLVEDVEIAKFVVNKNVTMTTSGDGKVVYGDGTKLAYDGLQANSSITGSVTNCMKPTYAITAMQLSATTGNLTESINGTGNIQVDSLYGVVCVNLSPISTYDIDTGWYEENFGFVIRDYGYKLCIQKAVAQKLVADCPLCGLVDLANRKILLNGVIEYRRYWHDSALIEQNKQTAFKSQGFGKNVIDLQRGTVTLEKDAPPVDTVPSNYLALHEHDIDGATHRFLGINEKIDRVAYNWMKLYAAEYAPATTTIINNLLDYQRGTCHVAVLPPNHPQINSVLSSLREQEVRFG